MAPEPSPWARAGLLLGTVVVVGALVGFGWEASLHAHEASFDEEAEGAEEEDMLPESPGWDASPSREEREVVRRATSGLPPYGAAAPRALAADYLDSNSRIAAAWFLTTDPPEQVLAFYRQALLDAGLPPVEHRYEANAGYVGYLDPATREVHVVSVLAQGGETVVFISSGQVEPFLQGRGEVPEELPLPEGARAPVVLTFRQEGRVQHSVTAEAPEAGVAELAAFFREAFAARGWVLEGEAEQEGGGARLQVSRGLARASVLVRLREEGGAQLHLLLDQAEQAPERAGQGEGG
jgi:hypothetical protein